MRRCLPLTLSTLVLPLALLQARDELPPPAPPAPAGGRGRPQLAKRDWTVKGVLYTPADAQRAAAADLAVLARSGTPAELYFYRYLAVYNFPAAMRPDVYRCSSFLLNSLSRETDTVRPAKGGPGDILIRVNLFDYGIDPAVWDKSFKKDPYFSQTVDKHFIPADAVERLARDAGRGPARPPALPAVRPAYPAVRLPTPKRKKASLLERRGPARADSPDRHKVVTLRGPAGWLDTEASKYLVATLQSEAPIVRADYFIATASLPPVYYDLLGLRTLNDYKKLVGFDQRADRIKQIRATVVKSGSGGLGTPVAYNNRALARTPTFNGAMWQTFDFLNNVKENNVVRNFAVNRRDAAEWIGNGPNGLQFYFLTDGNDNRVDEGAIAVVHDSTAKDGRVINGRSCIWCHSTGIQPFRSHFQLQVGTRLDQSDLGVFDKDPFRKLKLIRDLRRTFKSPDFDEVVKVDCATYTKAVNAANGMTAEDNASLFRRLWVGYRETDVDLARACYEVGLDEDDFKAIVPLKKDGRDDPVLLQLLLKPPVSIRREHWEEAFPEVMLRAVAFRLTHPLPQPPKEPDRP